eukprot:SAG22_NODE_1212_length_5155_cov_2.020767_1_plen_1241_part_00
MHWDAGELARSHGVAVAVEGEQEYEEAPLIDNLAGSDVWRTWGENGLVRAEDGLIISPSGTYPCKDDRPCHGWHVCQNAPKWHYATHQGLSRSGHFADAVSQDNAAGLIDQDGFPHVNEPGFNVSSIGSTEFCDWCNARFIAWGQQRGLNISDQFVMRQYLREVREKHAANCHAAPRESCESIQRDPIVHAYIKFQNQAWRDAFDLSRNATKQAAIAAGRIPPPVYGNLGGPLVHPFAIVMTRSVDVFWMEMFTWMSRPGHPTPQLGAGYSLDAPAADSSLSYKVAESAVWRPNGTWSRPVWSDTRRNIYNAPTRMWLAEVRGNGAVPFQMDGSLSSVPNYTWGDIDPKATFLPHTQFVNANRWLFTAESRDRIADAAIVFCLSCVEWRRMSSLNTGGRPTHFVQLSAIARLFEDTHTPYEIVLFGHDDLYANAAGAERLRTNRWKSVILPSVDVLSNKDIALLSAFVHHGGIIKTLGEIGVVDEELIPRRRSNSSVEQIAAAAGAGGALMTVPQRLFDTYATRSTESPETSAPLLRELMRGVDRHTIPWKIEGPGATEQPPRLWVNCWQHSLYATGRGRSGNSARVCHLVNYRLNMTPPLNVTGGLVTQAQSITVWVRGDFHECMAFSPTRNKTVLPLQYRDGMVGATLSTMDEYAVLAFGSSNDSIPTQAAAAEVRKWLSRLVIASGTTGVNISAIVPLLQDAELSLMPPPTGLDSTRLGVSKLSDLAEELQDGVQCIAAGAKQWQQHARQPVLDLQPGWSGHLLKLDFGDGPVPNGFQSVTAGASNGQCPRACEHALSASRRNPDTVCVCTPPAGGWPHNVTKYRPSVGFGFISSSNLQAGNTAGSPDAFHADAIISNRTATFRVDVPATGTYTSTVIVTLVVGANDLNVIESDGGCTPAEGHSRAAACRKFSNTFVDFWSVTNQSWVAVLPGARSPSAGWYENRAFRVPVQLSGENTTPYIKLRFRGGSFGSMHGDNHCGWAIVGLLMSDQAHLTPAAKVSLATNDRLAIAALREFLWVAPFDDRNATAVEKGTTGRPSLAKRVPPETHLPAMPRSTDTYIGQGGQRLSWHAWSDHAPIPIMDLSVLLASRTDQAPPLTDGMLGFAMTCFRPQDPRITNATLVLSTSGLGEVYLNGKLVATDSLDMGVFVGEVTVFVQLFSTREWNSLLIKTTHNEQPGASRWALLGAVFSADGASPMSVDVDANCGENKQNFAGTRARAKTDDDASCATSTAHSG